MKRWVAGAALATLLTGSSEMLAADFADRLDALPPTASSMGYSWAGTYFGVNLGYRWGALSTLAANPDGVAGGLQAGHNWQSGQFVFGGEGDIQIADGRDTFAPWQFSNPWFGSVRGRAGFAMNNVLFYATAGLAYGELKAQLAGAREGKSHVGWAAGAGMEVGLSRNWSARAEYLIMDLADRGYVMTGTNVGLETNLLRLGVNYRF